MSAPGKVQQQAAEAPACPRSLPPGLVAVVAIGLAAAALIKLDLSGRAFVAAGFCAVLAVLAAIDLERRVIPNRIVLPATVAVLLGNLAAEPGRAAEWAIACAAAGLVALSVALLARGGLGMGDAKLCFLLGAGLGWAVVSGLLIGVFAGAVAAGLLLLRHGRAARGMLLPYGPFLALGGVAALLLS
jgi:leader peptidase (prepilin peptidase)/N-methyltransferase